MPPKAAPLMQARSTSTCSSGRWVESLLGDMKFAVRHFARTPLTAIALVLVLSLGIGVNSALFSILQALTMRPAVPADDALVRIRGTTFDRTEGVAIRAE